MSIEKKERTVEESVGRVFIGQSLVNLGLEGMELIEIVCENGGRCVEIDGHI